MKLYIPTCTLNFNNILSSESISPLGFYAICGFGNKHFWPVCANDKQQVIISYSKYPWFHVEENGYENYPMVIEIETDDYKDGFFEKAGEYCEVETYLCYHTINLNPFHCRIYFDSQQVYQSVWSKAKQSLENKFYKLYEPNIIVKSKSSSDDLFATSEKDNFSWVPSCINYEIKNESIDISRDLQLDRIKGFIYCYLIGANSSVSKEVGKLKALSRKLRNTLSAVVNSPDKRPTQKQDDDILNGINEFNKIYSSIDKDSIENKNLLESELSKNSEGIPTEKVEKILRNLNLYDTFCNKLPLRSVYNANDLWSCLENPKEFAPVTDRMNNAVHKLEAIDNTQREKYAIETLLDVNDDLSLRILDNPDKPFYEKLIRSQFKEEYKSVMEEKKVEESLAQAFNGGKILKDILGDEWNSTYKNDASDYVNALLAHIQENSAFDLFSTKSDILSSFAAFCQKGDDIDRLVEYLEQQGFCNYKFVYGIYGATRGFKSLPKTFTSVLIDGNKDYYQSFASNVWRMLNGVEIKDAVLPKASNNTYQRGSKSSENLNNAKSKVRKQQKVGEEINKDVELENIFLSPETFMRFYSCFPHNSTAYKALKNAHFEEDDSSYTLKQIRDKVHSIVGKGDSKSLKKIDIAIELGGKMQDPTACLNTLQKYSESINDTARKKLISAIEQGNKAIPQDDVEKRNQRSINPTSSKFIEDKNVNEFINSRDYLPENM